MTAENITPAADERLTGQHTQNQYSAAAFYNLPPETRRIQRDWVLTILIEADKPLTREEIAERMRARGIKIKRDSVNGRIDDLRKMGLVMDQGNHGREGKVQLTLPSLT